MVQGSSGSSRKRKRGGHSSQPRRPAPPRPICSWTAEDPFYDGPTDGGPTNNRPATTRPTHTGWTDSSADEEEESADEEEESADEEEESADEEEESADEEEESAGEEEESAGEEEESAGEEEESAGEEEESTDEEEESADEESADGESDEDAPADDDPVEPTTPSPPTTPTPKSRSRFMVPTRPPSSRGSFSGRRSSAPRVIITAPSPSSTPSRMQAWAAIPRRHSKDRHSDDEDEGVNNINYSIPMPQPQFLIPPPQSSTSPAWIPTPAAGFGRLFNRSPGAHQTVAPSPLASAFNISEIDIESIPDQSHADNANDQKQDEVPVIRPIPSPSLPHQPGAVPSVVPRPPQHVIPSNPEFRDSSTTGPTLPAIPHLTPETHTRLKILATTTKFHHIKMFEQMHKNMFDGTVLQYRLDIHNIDQVAPDLIEKAAAWTPPDDTKRVPYHMRLFREDLVQLPASRPMSEVLTWWEACREPAPPVVSSLLGGQFHLLPTSWDGNSYWSAMAATMYGAPMYGMWVKAQHIAWFESVLGDPTHARHSLYSSIAKKVRFATILVAHGYMNAALSVRQILHLPNAFPPQDICQITADLYSIQIIRLDLRGNDRLDVQAIGPLNAPQKFFLNTVKFSHWDVIYPDTWAKQAPWEFRLQLTDVAALSEPSSERSPSLKPASAVTAEFGAIRKPLVNGHRFNERVCPPLIPRPSIPIPTNSDLSIAYGVEIANKPLNWSQGSTALNNMMPPLISKVPSESFSAHGEVEGFSRQAQDLHTELNSKTLAQIKSMCAKLKIKINPKVTKRDAIRTLSDFLIVSGSIATHLSELGIAAEEIPEDAYDHISGETRRRMMPAAHRRSR